MHPLLVVDTLGLVFRSYFAQYTRPLTNPQGRNIGAWFGFLKTVLAAVQDHQPRGVAFALESEGPTWRRQLYPPYKQNRMETPKELQDQIPLVIQTIRLLGWPLLQKEGFEADDCVASFVRQGRERGEEVLILSGDKDLMQLVGGPVRMLKPGKSGLEILDREGVIREKGVPPERILDWLSLVGDSSDNLPGVKGVGEKTATELLNQFGSWEDLWANLEAVKGSTRAKLEAGREAAELTRRLVTLRDDLELGVDWERWTLAPANPETLLALLEEQNAKTLVGPIRHLAAVKSQAGSPSADSPRSDPWQDLGEYRRLGSAEEVAVVLQAALEAGIVALDTETTGLDPRRAACLGFSLAFKEGQGYWVALDGPERQAILEHLGNFLSDPRLKVVAHNWPFDWKVLKTLGLQPPTAWFDTMTAAWLLDVNRERYKLEDVALQYLGLRAPDYEAVVPKGGDLRDADPDTVTRYAGKDADLALRLQRVFLHLLRERGLERLFFDIEMPVENLLCRMEWHGILVDRNSLLELGRDFDRRLRDLEAEAHRLAGYEFNLGSVKQLQRILFEELNLTPGRRTKTGLSTDSETLEELSDKHPLPGLILRWRQLAKLKSTYADTLPDLIDPQTGRIHTSFLITGTATGRLSSRDPNLQNIPVRDEEGRAIRKAFHAPPGWVLVSADYSQIELVVLAHFSEDPVLIQAFQEGVDIHRRTASLVFHVPEAEVTSLQRRAAKAVNFGIIYGMTPFRLARDLGISRTQAARIIDDYFQQLSRVHEWIQAVVEQVRSSGEVRTLLGRCRSIPQIRSEHEAERQGGERMAVNTLIQGSAADIMKLAMLRLDEALAAAGLEARLLLQVHDELLLECPAERTEEVGQLVRRTMEEAYPLRVPLRVSVESAPTWGDLH